MPRISNSDSKSRKQRVLELIQLRATGIRTTEIAEVLQFPERTVRSYLRELQEAYLIDNDRLEWFPINENTPLTLKPTPEEAVVIYIAMRMFVKQSDRRNPLAETLLLKMGQLANTELHLGDDLEQAAADLAQRPTDSGYEDIFLQVVRGYLRRLKLEIVYHPYKSTPFTTVIMPYLLEPSGIGFGAYVIGHSSTPNALRTYKLERIVSARLLQDQFEVPRDFPGVDILRNAWSIFYGEDTVRVVLRFTPEVARRVRESNWRGSNPILEPDPDNPDYTLYMFDIADTTDLKPWIRTWGANVEVLEPAFLRDEMVGEARALAHLYGWHTSSDKQDNHSRFSDIFGD